MYAKFHILLLFVFSFLNVFQAYPKLKNDGSPCITSFGYRGKCTELIKCQDLTNLSYDSKSRVFLESRKICDPSLIPSHRNKKLLVCCADSPHPPVCGIDGSDEVKDYNVDLPLSRRIFGGNATKIDQYPWLALLIYDRGPIFGKGFHCGASIITIDFVLTAAHCIELIPSSWTLVAVQLGDWKLYNEIDCDNSNNCNKRPQVIPIDKWIIHEDYDLNVQSQYNDIALIKLKSPAVFDKFVSPICLPFGEINDTENQMLIIAGWGKTENSSQSNIKLHVEVPLADFNQCNASYKDEDIFIRRSLQFCAGGDAGKDSCQGDSGGPIMMFHKGFWFLRGIVSFGPLECGTENKPGVYTNVHKYLNWISDKILI